MTMNIIDARDSGSVITSHPEESKVIIECDSTVVSDGIDEQVIIENPECTEIIWLGNGEYLKGADGETRYEEYQYSVTGESNWHTLFTTGDIYRRSRIVINGSPGPWTDAAQIAGKDGEKGDKGDPGIGIQGPPGENGLHGNDGLTKFTWVKYADTVTPEPEEMYEDPTNKEFVGIAYNRLNDEGQGDPEEYNYEVYKWSKIQGKDGSSIPGRPGDQGPAGPGFNWIGEFPEHPTEADIGRPLEDGDTYLNTTDGRVYTYAGGWHTMLENGGVGPIGPQGAPGGGFEYQGIHPSAPLNPLLNWLYQNSNDQFFYVYDGTAWTVATSDGKSSSDGAECGHGLRFFTTYHDSVAQPDEPLGDGTSGGWDPNPHNFPVGDIRWVSQKIATDPNLGAWNAPIDILIHGFRGPIGFRGSQTIMVPITNWNGIWDDNLAAQACTGGAPQEWDVVTMYKQEDPSVQDTRRWAYNGQSSLWEWLQYNYVFLGDVLVDGTVDGTAFNAATTITAGRNANKRAYMSGEGTYRFWAGHDDPAQAPFWVDEDGNGKFSGTLVLGGDEITDIDEITGRELRSIFRNATSQPSTPPNGNPPSGWAYSPTSPAVGSFTWACTAYFNGDGTQATSWSTPSIWGGTPVDGQDGADGTNGIDGTNGTDGTDGRELRAVYKTSINNPGRPVGTGYPPSGWSTTPTDPTSSARVWISTAWFRNGVMTDTQWGAPTIWSGIDGTEYDDGWIYPNQDNLSIKSSSYISGVQGWAIDEDGTAEFNNAVIRGTLFASDIEGDVVKSQLVTVNLPTPTSDFYDSPWQDFIIIPEYDHKVRVTWELRYWRMGNVVTTPTTTSYGNVYKNIVSIAMKNTTQDLQRLSHTMLRRGYVPSDSSITYCQGVAPNYAPYIPQLGELEKYGIANTLISANASQTSRTISAKLFSEIIRAHADNTRMHIDRIELTVRWWKED